MKKFSKLILESKSDGFELHPLMNPVDWEEIFLPLISHIEDNYNVPSPGDPVFTKKTIDSLISFMRSVNEDYKEYFMHVAYDGSQESFMSIFNINCDWDKLIDITRPLSDNCEEVYEEPNWDYGVINTTFKKFKFNDIKELIDDIEDICEKLKMFNELDYMITISFYGVKSVIIKSNSSSLEQIDSRLKGALNSQDITKLSEIVLSIYNEEIIDKMRSECVPNNNDYLKYLK